MSGKLYSVFNIVGYGNNIDTSEIPEDLECIIRNDFDVDGFKKSMKEHQSRGYELHKEIMQNNTSVDDFNVTIKRISSRGEKLKPFNNGLVRALKYGESRFMSIGPIRKLFSGSIEGYSTEDLVTKYCTFFEEQAEDFGDLFYHIVERENSLINYSNELINRDQFYESNNKSMESIIDKGFSEKEVVVEKITNSEEISPAVKQNLIRRTEMKYEEFKDSKNMMEILIKENCEAIGEIEGLVKWCSGMKNVLALSKERMDNYATHMKETMTSYLQATSLNRSFKKTNSAINGLAEVISAAQITADNGIENIVDFMKTNGIYRNPKSIRRFL